jgi:hypothetical protein
VTDAAGLVGLLADQVRLRVVAALVLGATSVPEVMDKSGTEHDEALRAIDRLVRGQLVRRGPEGLHVDHQVFQRAARAESQRQRAAEPTPESLGAPPEQARVLRNFLRDGRLTHLPMAPSKRRVVLDFLAGRFEPGRRYPEKEVNLLLGQFHGDVASLRRALVDEDFLARDQGWYWRSGGSVNLS